MAAARALVLAQVGMVATATDIEGDTSFGEVHARMLVVKGLDEFEASRLNCSSYERFKVVGLFRSVWEELPNFCCPQKRRRLSVWERAPG
jgi:hypothetical protein